MCLTNSFDFYIYKKNPVKRSFLISALFITCLNLKAQDPTPAPEPAPRENEPAARNSSGSGSFENRIFTGGDFGLQFGSSTYILVAPLVGYRITEQFSAGITGKYIYYSIKDDYAGFDYSTNIYGGGVFTRYNVMEEIFLHAEFEALSMEVPISVYEMNRRIVSGLFLGAGYRQFIGDYSSLNLMILFDVIEDKYSPYTNPQVHIGFDFGL